MLLSLSKPVTHPFARPSHFSEVKAAGGLLAWLAAVYRLRQKSGRLSSQPGRLYFSWCDFLTLPFHPSNCVCVGLGSRRLTVLPGVVVVVSIAALTFMH